MQDISDALKQAEHSGKKIVIPRFQRGQRWSKDQEDAFIDSVRKGYPVGTLLFYKTIEHEGGAVKEVYALVDGLQRGTAIHHYMQEPMKYYGEDEVSSEMVTAVFNCLGFGEGQKKNIAPIITKCYVDFIKGLKTLKNPQSYLLAKSILKQISVVNPEEALDKLIPCLTVYLEETIDEYDRIAKSTMPAVVYTGDESELPEIFNRINSKGTPLNQYEIYAASWPQKTTVTVKNSRIVDYVLAKYDALNDDIYQIQNYDREEIRKTRKLNYFEYVFGLGKWLSAEFPLIAFDKHLKPDEVSPIAFELFDACFFESKKIGEVYTVLQRIDVNVLESRLVECIKIVDSIVSPITRFKGNKRKDEIKPIYAKNQIISIIAFVFRERYCIDDLTKVKASWADKEALLKKRVFLHFVYDIINTEWDQGSGKLHTAINTGKYHEDIFATAWESALTNMFEKEILSQERTKVVKASNADIAFLNCIYLSRFTALDQLSLEKFDIEHIATKDLMKALIKRTSDSEGLPIGCVANLCYLPEFENRSKGNKTFYQDDGYLLRVTLAEIEEKYSFTTAQDLEWVELPYEMGDFEELRNDYIDFLRKRFAVQKRKFYEAIGVNPSVIGTVAAASFEISVSTVKTSDVYKPVVSALEKHFNVSFSNLSRTIIADNDRKYGAVLAYSKMYPQGKRRKYWFAIHPNKIEQCISEHNYYVFECSEDNVAVAFPMEYLRENLEHLNVSKPNNPKEKYYHMVLFVDGKNVSWLQSHPNLNEVDVSQYAVMVQKS